MTSEQYGRSVFLAVVSYVFELFIEKNDMVPCVTI